MKQYDLREAEVIEVFTTPPSSETTKIECSSVHNEMKVQSISFDSHDNKFPYSPRFLQAGSESAREIRKSPHQKILVLILLHNLISARVAERRYSHVAGYNARVAVTPIIAQDKYIRPSTDVFEEPSATLDRVKSILKDEVPNVMLVEANYSLGGTETPNFELFRILMEQYPSAKLVLHSMVPKCIKAVAQEFKSNMDVACLDRNESGEATFADEKELVNRAKNMGRRNTLHQ